MLLRFCIENYLSFKEPVEFNMFPSSKSKNHEAHKISCGHTAFLRLAAIYGANGAGKSNLIQAISLLQDMVIHGLDKITFNSGFKFSFDSACGDKPSEFAIEFSNKDRIYYYHISFDVSVIYLEELYESGATRDNLIFKRQDIGNNRVSLEIASKYATEIISPEYKDAMCRLIRPTTTFLGYVSEYYSDVMPMVTSAYSWIVNDMQVIKPQMFSGCMPHLMDVNSDFADMVNENISQFNTGVSGLVVEKEELTGQAKEDYRAYCDKARKMPGKPVAVLKKENDYFNIVLEDGAFIKKSIKIRHKMADGSMKNTEYVSESDGTHRLIEFMPMFYSLFRKDIVYIVDEIERSIHPILIKELVRIISDSGKIMGQLVFTTHESCLLDQNIFRPDEIWFAQKDIEQVTQLYPLSDFNVHRTANIENGYMLGRYGAIPFLANVMDLHW